MEYLDKIIEEMGQQQSVEQDKKEDQEMVDPNFVDLSQMLTINLMYFQLVISIIEISMMK